MKQALLIFISLSIAVIAASCYDNPVDNPAGNKAPETSVFLKPDSTISQQPSTLHVYWSGDDPDGQVVGFYYSWDGTNWTFTTKNDSLFSLQIGASDTNYVFRVAAVDNSGNGAYDNSVVQNQINYGPEPFIDANANGIYDNGETFYDIGLIDTDPASLAFPIKNTAPVVSWNALTVLPDTSFPVMSFGWNATDLDGDATIQKINIALNDTSNYVSLDGTVRLMTIRTKDYANPLMDILINGDPSKVASVKLPGLQLNADNVLYVQAEDISGAKSAFIPMPGEDAHWYVKQPKGKLLLVDDDKTTTASDQFYAGVLDTIGFGSSYDVYHFQTQKLPYTNITFFETLKLFNSVFWYSDVNPSLDVASGTAQKYLDAGGKMFLSFRFSASIDLTVLEGFLPIVSDSSSLTTILYNGTVVSANITHPEYPDLVSTGTIQLPRSFYVSSSADKVYYFPNNELKGNIGFKNSSGSLFFIGLPLHLMNGGEANVKNLFRTVLIDDFGLQP